MKVIKLLIVFKPAKPPLFNRFATIKEAVNFMTIIRAEDYNELGQQAFQQLLTLLNNKTKPLVCTASGDSPKGLYKQLTTAVANKQLDIKNWHFVSLDEWVGMNGNDEGSCRFHLDNDLYLPAGVSPENICFFDGRAGDPQARQPTLPGRVLLRGVSRRARMRESTPGLGRVVTPEPGGR